MNDLQSKLIICVEYSLGDKVVRRIFRDFHRLGLFINRCMLDNIEIKVIRIQ